jgi:S1-C subfamily serine protease
MMPIEFACEACGKTLSVKDEYAGRRGTCPRCGVIIVPPSNGYDVGPTPDRPKRDISTILPVDPDLDPEEPAEVTPSPKPGETNRAMVLVAGAASVLVVSFLGSYLGMSFARTPDVDRPAIEGREPKNHPIAGPVEDRTPLFPAAPLGIEEIVARCEPSVAVVRGPDSAGSGFLIAPGLLATNAHVIRHTAAADIRVLFPSAPSGQRGPHRAEVVYSEDDRDLAILAVESRIGPLNVDDRHSFRKGQEVVFIGNPVVGGAIILEAVAGRGIIGSQINLDGLGGAAEAGQSLT